MGAGFSADYMNLSKETREIIINKLDQHDALTLKVVSKACQEEVDTLYKFHINTEDMDLPTLKKALDFKIGKFTFYNFVHEFAMNEILVNRNTFFKYPKSVQSLQFFPPVGRGFPQAFYIWIIQECGENLRMLNVREVLVRDIPPVPAAIFNIDFKHLKILRYHYKRCLLPGVTTVENYMADFQNFGNLARNIKRSECGLKYLHLNMSSRQNPYTPRLTFEFISTFFSLIVEKHKSLETIEFVNDTHHAPLHDLAFKEPGISELFNLEAIEYKGKAGVKDISIRYGEFNRWKRAGEAWKYLLLIQKNLVNLELECVDFFLLNNSFLSQVISNNYQTIASINVAFSKEDISQMHDMSCLKNCANLESLTLNQRLYAFTDVCGPIKLKNFEIPISLLGLTLVGIEILTEDLISNFRRETNLREFQVCHCGKGEGFGFNAQALELLLNQPKLEFVYLEIEPPREEERERFREILNLRRGIAVVEYRATPEPSPVPFPELLLQPTDPDGE